MPSTNWRTGDRPPVRRRGHRDRAALAAPVVLMYCTVDNYLWLPRRRHRVATAGAGAFANLLVLLPCCALWLALPHDARGRDALAGLLLLGSAAAWFNLLPLPPLDGYKIFSHATGTTGCAGRAAATCGSRPAARSGAGRPVGYPRRARLVYPDTRLSSPCAAARWPPRRWP
ncbi:M50 family metallopeptidase [Streptomyces sp. M19]